MNFLKIINFCLLNIYSLGLFGGGVVTFAFKKDDNFETFSFLKQEGIINFFKEIGNDSILVEFSQDWILSFKKQRSKELELMFKEQKALHAILLENGIVKTSKNIENIRLAIKSYEETIPIRKKEESLSFQDFVSLYQDNVQGLVEEIKNTRSRLSGIPY